MHYMFFIVNSIILRGIIVICYVVESIKKTDYFLSLQMKKVVEQIGNNVIVTI